MIETHTEKPLSARFLLILHQFLGAIHALRHDIFSAFNWYLWNSILLFSRTFNVCLNWCSSSVEIFMSPLAKVLSCWHCSWPRASSIVKIVTKFCISLTLHAVICGGLYTLDTYCFNDIIISFLDAFFFFFFFGLELAFEL